MLFGVSLDFGGSLRWGSFCVVDLSMQLSGSGDVGGKWLDAVSALRQI